jgi:ferredoxin
MSWQRSRGIHAARPTPRRLRSACTQVAICGVCTIDVEEQNQQQKQPHQTAMDARCAFASA